MGKQEEKRLELQTGLIVKGKENEPSASYIAGGF